MIEIIGTVTGDKQVVARLSGLTPSVRASLVDAMNRITIDMQGYVVKNKLSGQLLKRRTGTLAASIQHRVVSNAGDVTGVVGSRINESAPLKYAYPLENGFDGVVTVKEHLRQMTTAFGRTVKDPHKVTVRAHARHVHTRAYKYLASSLAERRGDYIEQLRQAVARGVKNGS